MADIYTTPGDYTWTAPSAGSVVVECWGGGQAGEDGSPFSFGMAGGKGGSYAKKTMSVTASGYAVHVGAGGASGLANGGDSYFVNSSTCLAKGGNSSSTNTGDTTFVGGSGGLVGSAMDGGGGGSSAGTAANGNAGDTGDSGGAGATAPSGGGNGGHGGAASSNGSPGVQPGGGGGGSGGGDFSGYLGGAGGDGKVVITFTASGTTAHNLLILGVGI